MTRALVRIGEFLRMESAAGIILIFAAAFALIASNSPFAAQYAGVFQQYLQVGFGEQAINKPILLWINDALMAIFFLLVGLEIKREMMEGALSSVSKATLPVLAAIGGMVGIRLSKWLADRLRTARLAFAVMILVVAGFVAMQAVR